MKNNIIQLDLRFLVTMLLVIIAVMLFLWKPWSAADKGRTITVKGEATVTAIPDEYIFSPNYEVRTVKSEEAVSKVSEIGNSVVARLKELGVESKDIKTQVNSNRSYEPSPNPSQMYIANYSITATVRNSDQMKKILEYLGTTPLTAAVTPYANFSKDLQKKLEAEARGKALEEAKKNAVVIADQLDVKLDGVSAVSEPNQIGGPITLEAKAEDVASSGSARVTTPIFEPGSQELSYTFNVTYRIK